MQVVSLSLSLGSEIVGIITQGRFALIGTRVSAVRVCIVFVESARKPDNRGGYFSSGGSGWLRKFR